MGGTLDPCTISRQTTARSVILSRKIALFFKTRLTVRRRPLCYAAPCLFSLPLRLLCHSWRRTSTSPSLAVANGANNTLFRSDVRIFNPSTSDNLVVTATFLKANNDNTSAGSKTITIPKRQMVVLNNIVQNFFNTTGLGAIFLTADGEFDATSRLYTDSPNGPAAGTFGQFVTAVIEDQPREKGALLQLSNSTDLTTGFRSNIGFMNPNTVAVTVAVRLISANGTVLEAATSAPFHREASARRELAPQSGATCLLRMDTSVSPLTGR